MAKNTNMLSTLNELDSRISSYADTETSEKRERVVNELNGKEGIIVSYDTEDPSGKKKGKGHIVKWKVTGEMTFHPKTELENENSDIHIVKQDFMDTVVTFNKYPKTVNERP